MATPLEFIQTWKYPGLFGLLLVEESGIPMPFPGDWALIALGASSRGKDGVWLPVVAIAVGAVTTGGSLLFTIARRAGPPLLKRFGKRVGISEARRLRWEAWVHRRGTWALLIGRLIPGMRVLLTAASGALGMERRSYTLTVPLAAFIWSSVYFWIGWGMGESYERLAAVLPGWVGVAVGSAIAIGVIVFLVRKRLKGRRPAPPEA